MAALLASFLALFVLVSAVEAAICAPEASAHTSEAVTEAPTDPDDAGGPDSHAICSHGHCHHGGVATTQTPSSLTTTTNQDVAPCGLRILSHGDHTPAVADEGRANRARAVPVDAAVSPSVLVHQLHRPGDALADVGMRRPLDGIFPPEHEPRFDLGEIPDHAARREREPPRKLAALFHFPDGAVRERHHLA